MLTRYLLRKTIHVGEQAAPWECCHILSKYLMSVQQVCAHVSGLESVAMSFSYYALWVWNRCKRMYFSGLTSTSTFLSKAMPHTLDTKKWQMLWCWPGTCWAKLPCWWTVSATRGLPYPFHMPYKSATGVHPWQWPYFHLNSLFQISFLIPW